MDQLFTIDNLVALLTLTGLEIVLGIDNVVFIAILAGKLPDRQQSAGRQVGLALAMLMRICLLLTISWVMGLTADLFHLAGNGISGRDLVLLLGGLFLLWKASHEIFVEVEAREQDGPPAEAVIPGGARG